MSNHASNNTQQAFWIGFGSLFSFGFSLVSAAILSRYLTKDEYGTYKQVMYVYNTLLVVFTLGLPRAYSFFLPRVSLLEGPTLVKKLNICFLLLGLIFSAVLYFSADYISVLLKNDNLSFPLKLFSPTPLFLLPTMGLEGVLATYRKTHWNAIYTISTRLISIIFVALPVIIVDANCKVAVIGFTASSVFCCVIGLFFMHLPFKGLSYKERTQISFREIFAFSLPLMFAGFWGIMEKAADQFFISRWFGEAVFADFSNGSMELPFVGMVLSAGAVVLLPIFSRMNKDNADNRDIIKLWQRAAVKAAYILYPLIAFCWFFSDIIMTFLYGNEYVSSGLYFKIMLLSNFFTIAQYYPILLALGKTKFYSNTLMIAAITVWIIEYLIVVTLPNPYYVTMASVIVKIVKIIVFLILIANLLHCRLIKLFPYKELLKLFVCSVIAGSLAYIVIVFIPFIEYKIWQLTMGGAVFIVLELMLAQLFKIDYLDLIRPVLLKLRIFK